MDPSATIIYGFELEDFGAYHEARQALGRSAARFFDWGCDGCEDAYAIGVSVVRGTWDEAEVIDPMLFSQDSELKYQAEVSKLCDSLNIELRACKFLMLVEQS